MLIPNRQLRRRTLPRLAVTGFFLTAPGFTYWVLFFSLFVILFEVGRCSVPGCIFLSFLLMVAMFIVGIICGHIAASRIKKSDGVLRGRRLARAAYLLGYLWLVVGLFFYGIPFLADFWWW